MLGGALVNFSRGRREAGGTPHHRPKGGLRTCYSADRSGDDRCARLSEVQSAQSDSRPSPHQARRRSVAGASRRSCVSARLSSRGGGCRLCADPVEDGRVALVVDSVCFGVGGSEQAEQESEDRGGGSGERRVGAIGWSEPGVDRAVERTPRTQELRCSSRSACRTPSKVGQIGSALPAMHGQRFQRPDLVRGPAQYDLI